MNILYNVDFGDKKVSSPTNNLNKNVDNAQKEWNQRSDRKN